jgi:two-component system, chemotaxis family, response regulator Rcp1
MKMDQARAGGTKLLVIEDNPADVELLRRALAAAQLDCQLTVVDDGADALALFRPGAGTQVPDLAIVDLNLPKHSGLEVIEQMRANPNFADVPIVIMSSSSARRDRSSLEKLRISKYIVKPADLEEFMKIGWQIREVLGIGSAQAQVSASVRPS